jgi:hypothetical protein
MDYVSQLPYRQAAGVELLRTGPRDFDLVSGTSGYFRLGAKERYLLFLVEKAKSWEELHDQFVASFPEGIGKRDLDDFLGQLLRRGLLVEGSGSTAALDPGLLDVAAQPAASKPIPAGLNLLLDFMLLFFGWLIHPLWAVLATGMAALAAVALWQQGDRLLAEGVSLWKCYPFVPLLLISHVQTLLALNIPAVMFTGMICRKYREPVKEMGVHCWRDLMPLFYVEPVDTLVSLKPQAMWALIWSKLFFDLGAAAFYILAWAACGPQSETRVFWAMMFLPGVLAVGLQCNPFLPNSVYWILVMKTRQWHLLQDALGETRAWLTWNRSPRAMTGRERFWMRVYGLGYYAYRITFESIMIVGAGFWLYERFGRDGMLVGAVLALWMYFRPLTAILGHR